LVQLNALIVTQSKFNARINVKSSAAV